MKLDPTVLRTMGPTDFRVLEAVEKGMQKHALVPSSLIASLSSLRHGGTGKILSSLLRDKLLSHDQSCGYDGYRITTAGYDILTLYNLKARKIIAAIGDRIGTGKESDIYLAVRPNGDQIVLKFHRLGRTSFRNVKKTRDYFVYHQKGRNVGAPKSNQANSWLFLSRKSALKEFAFMKALYSVDYPTPEPIAHNRHVVAMTLIRGVPLYQIVRTKLSAEQAASIFHQASDLALRLAKHGLVHCDLNEFNLIVDMSGIQQKSLSQEHDHYVRHSGMSVAAETNPGMLSARGPWEPDHLQRFQPDHQSDDGGNETTLDPVGYLENGEPRPVVTLIDFPQMVSTRHPNARQLYERDTACLLKFFTHKLQFTIPESELETLFLTWDSVLGVLENQQQSSNIMNDIDAEIDIVEDSESVCLASKAQLRLDEQLKASGYTDVNAGFESELQYYSDGNDSKENSEDGDANGENSDSADCNGPDDDERSREWNDDNISLSMNSAALNIYEPSELANLSRLQLQEQARVRVQLQLESQKKKNRQSGAFRKRNSNKSYSKGKRVYSDQSF
jgi:RIO kinase 2